MTYLLDDLPSGLMPSYIVSYQDLAEALNGVQDSHYGGCLLSSRTCTGDLHRQEDISRTPLSLVILLIWTFVSLLV